MANANGECEWRKGFVLHFDPQKLAVYRLAREHTRAIHKLVSSTNTKGFSGLVSQLRESVASIPANVLEAFGEWQPGKRLNYLSIAKGSTWESWGHLDTMVDFNLITQSAADEVHAIQHQITSLLVTMIRKLEEQRGGEGADT